MPLWHGFIYIYLNISYKNNSQGFTGFKGWKHLQIKSEAFDNDRAKRYLYCLRYSFCKVMPFQGFLLVFEIRKNLDLRKILVTPKIFLQSRFHCTFLLHILFWFNFNVCTAEKCTKRSSNILLRLLRFSAVQTLLPSS